MWHAMRRLTYVCTGLCLKNLRKLDHLEDVYMYVRIIIKRILKKLVCRMWTRLIRIKVGTNSGMLWTRRWTSRFQKRYNFFFKKNMLHGLIGNAAQWSNRISSEDRNLDLRSSDHWRWRVVSSVQDKALVPFLHWRTSKSALLSGGVQKAATIWEHRAATVLLQTAVSSGVQLTRRK